MTYTTESAFARDVSHARSRSGPWSLGYKHNNNTCIYVYCVRTDACTIAIILCQIRIVNHRTRRTPRIVNVNQNKLTRIAAISVNLSRIVFTLKPIVLALRFVGMRFN